MLPTNGWMDGRGRWCIVVVVVMCCHVIDRLDSILAQANREAAALCCVNVQLRCQVVAAIRQVVLRLEYLPTKSRKTTFFILSEQVRSSVWIATIGIVLSSVSVKYNGAQQN